MNKVIISGNLGKEPELRDAGGTPVANFSVAVKGYKDETEWVNVVAWDKTASNCKKFLDKGSKVLVEGRLQTRSYEKDGVTRYMTEVIANQVEFMDKPKQQSVPGGVPF